MALLDEHCQQSDVCKERGACAVEEGVCVLSDAACAKRPMCLDEGRCHASGPSCVALDSKDCRPSKLCKEQGRCVAVNGRCQAKQISTGPGPVVPTREDLPQSCLRFLECLEGAYLKTAPAQTAQIIKSVTKSLLSVPYDQRGKTCTTALSSMAKNLNCP